MIDLARLHRQNHAITEIVSVFLYLARDRSLCDTDTVCELFFDGVTRILDHLEEVDRLVKRLLLNAPDPWARNLARKVTAESDLLRRDFADYRRRWSEHGLRRVRVAAHGDFLADSDELLGLVLQRIQRETEHLYPLLRELEQDDTRAA